MQSPRHLFSLRRLIAAVCNVGAIMTLVLSMGPIAAAQTTYGCGAYGAGNYSAGKCGTATASTVRSTTIASDATTPAAPAGSILLNTFVDFSGPTGQQLDVSQGQVLFFNLGGRQYSITIKSIDPSQVVVTMSAPEQVDVTVPIGQATPYDVDIDGHADISLGYISLNGNVATMKFHFLALPAMTPVAGVSSNATSGASPQRVVNLWWVWIIAALIGVGLLFWAIISTRRRKRAEATIGSIS